jgi:hypothetical protein
MTFTGGCFYLKTNTFCPFRARMSTIFKQFVKEGKKSSSIEFQAAAFGTLRIDTKRLLIDTKCYATSQRARPFN